MAGDLNPVEMKLQAGGDLANPETSNSTASDNPPSPGLPQPPSAVADHQDDAPGLDIPLPEEEPSKDDYPPLSDVRKGELRKGIVVGVSPSGVVVDIGSKTEGIVPAADFKAELPEIGDEIEVVVTSPGAPGDYASLSHQSARQRILRASVESAYKQRATITGKVVGAVKGGLTVDIGLPAFLPSSQIDIRPPADPQTLVGSEVEVRVVKFNGLRGNAVVSRRALLEAEIQRLKKETLAKLSKGAVVTGTVKNITSYGAFVDLGGLDALLHLTDLSYSRVKHPSEVVKVGDAVTAKVIKFDPEKEKVSLSVKALEPDPWEGASERYHEGERITGRVSSITDYGAFVEVEKGLEGLIHSSEMGWSRRVRHPSKVLQLGQRVECLILKVEPEARRLSLSLKALRPDPWATAAERYKVGTILEGKVLNLASYGAFVEAEEGIDGLIHITDLTRDSKIRHPKEILKKGQEVKAVVLRADTENRRLSLGVKQLEPDAWDTFFASHLVGDEVEGRVTRRVKYGVFVEVAPGVEALCHNSELGKHSGKKSKLQVGQTYPFKIVNVDDVGRRIRLSRRGLPPAEAAAQKKTSAKKGSKANISAKAKQVNEQPQKTKTTPPMQSAEEKAKAAATREQSPEEKPEAEEPLQEQAAEKAQPQEAATQTQAVEDQPPAEGPVRTETGKEESKLQASPPAQAVQEKPSVETFAEAKTAEEKTQKAAEIYRQAETVGKETKKETKGEGSTQEESVETPELEESMHEERPAGRISDPKVRFWP